MKWLGIDEAGRGCVLGDLVVAGFLYEGDDPASLAALGATDSKKLSSKRRLEAREKLFTAGTPIIERVTPAQIDAGNLNHLEEQAIAGIIQRTKPDMVIIDALGHPSTLPATIQRLLQRTDLRVVRTQAQKPLQHPARSLCVARLEIERRQSDQQIAVIRVQNQRIAEDLDGIRSATVRIECDPQHIGIARLLRPQHHGTFQGLHRTGLVARPDGLQTNRML